MKKKKLHSTDTVVGYAHTNAIPEKKRGNCQCIKCSFSLIFKAFLLHFCSYNVNFSSVRSLFMFIISLACDAYIIIIIIRPWFIIDTTNVKNVKVHVFRSFCFLCGLMFRFLLHKKGHKLEHVVHQISKIHSVVCSHKRLYFRNKIVFALVLSIIYNLSLSAFLYFFIIDQPNGSTYSYPEIFFIRLESTVIKTVISSVIFSLLYWFVFSIPVVLCIYFHFVCYVLTQTLKNCIYSIEKKKSDTIRSLLMKKDIFDMLSKVIQKLHALLLYLSAFTVTLSFFTLYQALFDPVYNMNVFFPALFSLIGNFSSFIVICFSSSSVTNSYTSLRHACQRLLLQNYKDEDIVLILIICKKKHLGFTLLDSVTIDKSLAADVLGTMLTYGIIIATMWQTSNV